jgi:hypothetical protein
MPRTSWSVHIERPSGTSDNVGRGAKTIKRIPQCIARLAEFEFRLVPQPFAQ